MDTRSAKYRSLDAKAGKPPLKPRERHNSAPTVDRRKEQHHRRPSAVAKASDAGHRSTKSHGRGESLASPDRTTGTRHPDRRPPSDHALAPKPSTKVHDSPRLPAHLY